MYLEIKDYLKGDRLLHTMRVVEKTIRISDIYHLSREEQRFIVNAAEYHDIGYSEKIIKTGFHPLDGYLFLKDKVELSIAGAVLLHSLSEELVKYQSEEVQALFYKEYQFLQLNNGIIPFYIDILSMADMLINSKGIECTTVERYYDIVKRYGAEDYRSVVFKMQMERYAFYD